MGVWMGISIFLVSGRARDVAVVVMSVIRGKRREGECGEGKIWDLERRRGWPAVGESIHREQYG